MKLLGISFWEDDADKEKKEEELKSVVREPNDGSEVVEINNGVDAISIDGRYGEYGSSHTTFDVDPSIVSEYHLITKYREVSMEPIVEVAIDDIVNEMCSITENKLVTIDLDELEYQESLKTKIRDEFEYVLGLLDFNSESFDTMKRFYVDGRLTYQVVVSESDYREIGISKLVYIDPRLIKKVRVVKRDKDLRTGTDLYAEKDEYYMFSETGFGTNFTTQSNQTEVGTRLSKDAVVQITSGLLNPSNTVVLSHLHKAIRSLNQLKNLEDAAIIYRLSRAPERRVFYIDVGNLPPAKAEQVLKRQAQQYRSKMVYDVGSGMMRSDPRTLIMTEDYFLPRRTDGKATEITTLPGGQNLGEMNEIEYFLNKVYKALNVPVSRMDPQAGFNFGRVSEITRDEVKFMKFIARLRNRFAMLFHELLKRQLALKNIIHPDEFDNIRHLITFEFASDSIFEESKDNEILSGRLDLLAKVHDYRGVYFSDEYIKRTILHQSADEIEEMDEQMDAEESAGVYEKGTGTERMQQDMADVQAEVALKQADAAMIAAKNPHQQVIQQEPQPTQTPVVTKPSKPVSKPANQ